MSAIATLGGVPLLGKQTVGWTLTAGTRPYQRVFEVDRDMGKSLRSGGGGSASAGTATQARFGPAATSDGGGGISGPVDLMLAAPGHRPAPIQKLYIMALLPGSRPETMGVLVADRRALLRRKTLARTYNWRRRTGEWSYASEGGLIENRPLKPDIAFAPWSLKSSATVWKPMEALEDAMKACFGSEYKLPGQFRRKIPVEHFDEAGDAAMVLEALLAHLGGYDLTIDPDGTARVFDARDRSEIAAVQAATPVLYMQGWADVTSRAHWRPKKVIVRFDREAEIRFDYREDDTLDTATTARNATKRESRDLENVLPATDPSLTVGGRTLAPNTWMTFPEFYEATEGTWPRGRNLSHVEMRRYAMIPDYYDNYFVFSTAGQPDQTHEKRIAVAVRNWRHTFRIVPRWRDKLRSFRVTRVSILDPVTGTRADAPVYCDWIKKHSYAHIYKTRAENPSLGYQVQGYADLLSNATAAPARVTMVDEEGGVFRVDLKHDPFGQGMAIFPGNVAEIPTMSMGDSSKKLIWVAPLEDGWKLAIVLTCLQACPNNEGRFHAVEVSPGEAAGVLGEDIGACDGEPWEIKIGGGLLTAKFAWKDELEEQIEGAFFDGKPYPPDLLINREEVRDVAVAEAAAIYGSMLDRVEGAFSTPINPTIVVTGALSAVQHSIDPRHVARTYLSLAPELEPLPADAFIPQSTRRIIRRQVQP